MSGLTAGDSAVRTMRAKGAMEGRMAETRKIDIWTPGRLLTVWGLRTVGGALTNPSLPTEGGVATSDDEWQAVRYVEATNGYGAAKPLLTWIHVDFKRIEEFRMVLPGETILGALARLGWTRYLYQPTEVDTVKALPGRVYDMFVDELAARWKGDPFVPMREMEPPDANEIGEQAGDELNAGIDRLRKHGRL